MSIDNTQCKKSIEFIKVPLFRDIAILLIQHNVCHLGNGCICYVFLWKMKDNRPAIDLLWCARTKAVVSMG